MFTCCHGSLHSGAPPPSSLSSIPIAFWLQQSDCGAVVRPSMQARVQVSHSSVRRYLSTRRGFLKRFVDTSWLFLCLGSRADCASHSLPVVGWSVSCLTVMCYGTNRHGDNPTQIVPYLKPTRTCDEAVFVEAQPTEKMGNPIVSALATTVYGSVQTPALGFHDFHVILCDIVCLAVSN